MGGDDFLQKPIHDTHLVRAVHTRVRRFRRLSLLMTQDSLTGLRSHTVFKQTLDSLISYSVRKQKPLAVAMIDIDHFKTVNDTYGHPTDDSVIKNLSQMLSKRLRKSDLIARYGGEEFAVALADTTPAAACAVLNEIRLGFSEVLHSADQHTFQVTFSAGIAGAPPYTDVEGIIDAADRALYKAKRTGRNQVVLSESATGG